MVGESYILGMEWIIYLHYLHNVVQILHCFPSTLFHVYKLAVRYRLFLVFKATYTLYFFNFYFYICNDILLSHNLISGFHFMENYMMQFVQ